MRSFRRFPLRRSYRTLKSPIRRRCNRNSGDRIRKRSPYRIERYEFSQTIGVRTIGALINMLVVSLSCSFAIASEPPTKAKPVSEPAVSAKRQAKLDAIHAKRKAASQRKHHAVANQHGSFGTLESSIRNTDRESVHRRRDGRAIHAMGEARPAARRPRRPAPGWAPAHGA
jgi:hypothetical protein